LARRCHASAVWAGGVSEIVIHTTLERENPDAADATERELLEQRGVGRSDARAELLAGSGQRDGAAGALQ
jgi:hypothetical protein